jgi:hypothetical protein
MSASPRPAALPIPRRRLWLGLVLAPGAWLVAFTVGYVIVSRSCEGDNGMHATGVAGVRWVDLALALVMAGVAMIGLLTAVGSLREAERKCVPNDLQAEIEAGALDPEARGDVPWWGRELFMARAGVIASTLFLVGTLLFAFSPLVLNVCSQAR